MMRCKNHRVFVGVRSLGSAGGEETNNPASTVDLLGQVLERIG